MSNESADSKAGSRNLGLTAHDAAPQTGGVRFAPSPTGRFHIGNLRTAWISHQWARTLSLPWVVRFEDIDTPRVLPGAQDAQLADLAQLGLVPDVVGVQSQFRPRHLELFHRARREGMIYPCRCSRREVQVALSGLASAPHDGVAPIYSGHCRFHPADADTGAERSSDLSTETPPTAVLSHPQGVAWRFKMPRLDGQNDFIVARTNHIGTTASPGEAISDDGFVPAYHWACAIDDFDGAYDLIVRSADLATALPLQRAIQGWLSGSGESTHMIRAFHTSLVTQDDGHRLEKRTAGVTLPELLNSGWTVDRLLERFNASFDRLFFSADPFDHVGVAGEKQATVLLSSLLF